MAGLNSARRKLLIASVCAVAGASCAGAAPAPAATFTASLGDAVSGTASAPKGTTLAFAVDVRGAVPSPETPGITNLSLQLPAGSRVTTGSANGCTQDALRAEPVPPACSTQIGSGVATGYGIGIFFDAAPVSAYRDPDGVSLNLRLVFLKGGISVVTVVHVAVTRSLAGGASLDMAIPPIQLSDNEYLDLYTLNVTLGNSSTTSAIATTACTGSWPLSGSVVVRGGTSTPLSATQTCTQGAEPPPVVPALVSLPRLAPSFTLSRVGARGRVLGRLSGIGGLRSLPNGVAATARCVSGCVPRKLGTTTLGPSTPKGIQLRPRKPVRITAASRVELDAVGAGRIGRYAVFRFVVRGRKLVARAVESGCLTPSGSHATCGAAHP